MKEFYKMHVYRDCCCSDCAEYGREAEDECEVFNAAVAQLPQNFGEGIKIGPCTSPCNEFSPSAELLRDIADSEAMHHENARRMSEMGRRDVA